eukprot:m.238608 g.238608  ORF g.238608 m.238608 type:complete len:489 (-) comp19392_c0_seq1:525-1991(-)
MSATSDPAPNMMASADVDPAQLQPAFPDLQHLELNFDASQELPAPPDFGSRSPQAPQIPGHMQELLPGILGPGLDIHDQYAEYSDSVSEFDSDTDSISSYASSCDYSSDSSYTSQLAHGVDALGLSDIGLGDGNSRMIPNDQHALQHQQHHGKFPCPFNGCTRVFSRPSHLEKHKRIHTNERPHKCGTCDMAFKTKWTLTKHMRTHTGEKPFKCEIPGCGKEFTQRGSYCRHMRSHSDDAPTFTCEKCDKKFKQRSNYTLHLKSHGEGKPFKCAVCQKCFKSERGLDKHRLTHITREEGCEIVKHRCKYCSKVFHCMFHPDRKTDDILRFEEHVKAHTAQKPLHEIMSGSSASQRGMLHGVQQYAPPHQGRVPPASFALKSEPDAMMPTAPASSMLGTSAPLTGMAHQPFHPSQQYVAPDHFSAMPSLAYLDEPSFPPTSSSASMGLLARVPGHYRMQPTLQREHGAPSVGATFGRQPVDDMPGHHLS